MPDPSLAAVAAVDSTEESYAQSDLSALDFDRTTPAEGADRDGPSGTPDEETFHRRKATELYLNFQWKSLVQTVDVINKGIGFYFVVLIGVTGVVYQAKVTGPELLIAVVAIALITVAVCTACGFLAWGVVSGLLDVQDTLESFHPQLFAERRLSNYFRRARIAARAAMICSLCIALTIIGTLVMLNYR